MFCNESLPCLVFSGKPNFFIIYVKQPHPFFIANAYNFTKMHDIILVSPLTCTTTTYIPRHKALVFAECKVEKETIMTQKTTKSGRHKRENENESKFFSN